MPIQIFEKEGTQYVGQEIPQSFVYEEIGGKPIYYKDYKKALAQNLNIEAVMGASEIQSLIIACIVEFLNAHFFAQKPNLYKILYSELGMHLSLGNNVAADIAIYEREKLKNYVFKGKYIELAPKIVIEVDVQADMANFVETFDYIETKTSKLLEFGVEKVFWVLSQNKKVMVFAPKEDRKKLDWKIIDWSEDITVLGNCTFSIAKLIEEDGILAI